MNNTFRDRIIFAAAACFALISIIWFCSTHPVSPAADAPVWEQMDAVAAEPVPEETESAAPAPETPHVFVNVLLQQEVVGNLLDNYVPRDIYCDLDTWEDESVTELSCYVYYYGLSRAQFRQFMEGLETVPDELKDIELEGGAEDVANITVSGVWSRAEIERLRAAVQQTQQTLTPEEGFTDIMGYTGYAVTERQASSWYLRTYYTVQGGGPLTIAETFGYGQPQDFVVDLDGDGVTELVANVTFGGDGARRAYVYQRRGEDVYLGDPSADGLPDFNNWGANASWSEYDPLEQVFRIHYSQKNSDEYGVLETRDLSRFQFSKFTP